MSETDEIALPEGARVIEDLVVAPRAPWSARLAPGDRLRFVDLEGCQAVDFLAIGAEPHDGLVERYDLPNTVKMNANVYVRRGTVLYSDAARAMLTVIEDTVGRHDTLGGCCSFKADAARYGAPGPAACRDNFEREMVRHGLGPEHIVPNVNFFMNVPVAEDGHTAISQGISKPGDWVELRAEMALIALVSNCPQERNPAAGGAPTPIRAIHWRPDEG
ncbi:MAG: DUF1989 domain-containing protein [Paracoccaceae bacterium]